MPGRKKTLKSPRRGRSSSRGASRSRSSSRGRSKSRGRSNSRVRYPSEGRAKPLIKAEEKLEREGKSEQLYQGPTPAQRELNVMVPTNVSIRGSALQKGGIIDNIVSLIIAKIDSVAPGYFSSVLTDVDHPTPGQLKGCLMTIAWLFAAKAGIIQNPSFLSVIPEMPGNTPVPVALAKALQYLCAYTSSEGQRFSYQDTMASLPAITQAQAGLYSAGANLLDSGVVDVMAKVIETNSGEYITTSGSTMGSWQNSVFTPLVSILTSLAALGFQCVDFDKIPLTAPDASVYPAYDITNKGFLCSTREFDPEVAFLFQTNASFGTLVGFYGGYRKPIPAQDSVCTGRGINLAFNSSGTGNLLIGWIEVVGTSAWHDGTVKKMIQFCKWGKMRTFMVECLDANLRQWHSLVAAELVERMNNYVSQGTTPTQFSSVTGQEQWSLFIAVLVALESVLYARLGSWSYLTCPSEGQGSSLTYNRWYSQSWTTLEVPPWVGIYLWAIGPAVVNGRLRLALPYQKTAASASVPTWLTYGSSTALGMLGESANPTLDFFQGTFGTEAIAPVTAQAMSYENVAVPNAGYGVALRTNYPMTPIAYQNLFSRYYNKFMQIGSTAQKGGLVTADLNKSYGGVPMLAYVEQISFVGATNAAAGRYAVGPFGTLGTNALRRSYMWLVNSMASDVQLSKIDVALSAFVSWLTFSAQGTNDPTMFVRFELNNLQLAPLLDTLVALEDGPDFTQVIEYAKARSSKLRAIHGEAYDPDIDGMAFLAALAGIAGPILANVLPPLIRWVSSKFTDTEEGSFYSEFGQGVRGGVQEIEDQNVRRAKNSKKNLGKVKDVKAIYANEASLADMKAYAEAKGETLPVIVVTAPKSNVPRQFGV